MGNGAAHHQHRHDHHHLVVDAQTTVRLATLKRTNGGHDFLLGDHGAAAGSSDAISRKVVIDLALSLQRVPQNVLPFIFLAGETRCAHRRQQGVTGSTGVRP